MSGSYALLAAAALLIAASLYRAQKDPAFSFNLFDLLTEQGKVSRIGCTFMAAFSLTSWIMLDLQMRQQMTEGYLTVYGAMWVAPLVARVIFGRKTEVKV